MHRKVGRSGWLAAAVVVERRMVTVVGHRKAKGRETKSHKYTKNDKCGGGDSHVDCEDGGGGDGDGTKPNGNW